MEPELRIVLEALTDRVFAKEEPTREELEKLRRALSDGYVRLVSLLLNLRLALQWQDFGVSHSSIGVDSLTAGGTLPFRIRVHDPSAMEGPICHALTYAGFLGVHYRVDAVSTMGGWVEATASAPLVQRLRG